MAVVDTEGLSCTGRIDFDNAAFDGQFAASLKKIVSAHRQIDKVNITSCVKDLAVRAKALCAEEESFGGAAVDIVAAHKDLPVSIGYDEPQSLGTDRLCNALACAVLFKSLSCIIIASGTAITIDYLHKGERFEGGVIMPGCVMQARALHYQTDALPLVDLRIGGATLPSSDTKKCINSGILFGTAGAVERCVSEYLRHAAIRGRGGAELTPNNPQIVATGGGWGLIEPLVRLDGHEIKTVPDLTLIGAAIYR
jgi:type III pantothenate kinase